MRLHLFEFEDLEWFPDVLRKSMLDYLSFFLRKVDFYKPIVPILVAQLEKTGQKNIIDLCSGGGGPVIQLQQQLKNDYGVSVHVTLTDKYPNTEAYQHLKASNTGVDYVPAPVDAAEVPVNLNGLRTMFSAFHHFKPAAAKSVLNDAAKNKMPIVIFDGHRNLLNILGIILIHPIMFFFCTPFFKPFRWSRLLFTYVIPLIVICTVWDGIASMLRLYAEEDIKGLLAEIDAPGYEWSYGAVKHPLGFKIFYLAGSVK